MDGAPIELFAARTVMRLLLAAVLRDPPTFAAYLDTALSGPVDVANAAGQVWAVAQLRDAIEPPLLTELARLQPPARRGAAAVHAEAPIACLEALTEALEDEDAEVRSAAAEALRSLTDIDVDDAEQLLQAFLGTLAFDEHFDDAVGALDRRQGRLPDSALLLCERAVRSGGSALGDIRLSRAATADHVASVVLRLYRQGDARTREQCLNIIDELVSVGAYGIDQKLDDTR